MSTVSIAAVVVATFLMIQAVAIMKCGYIGAPFVRERQKLPYASRAAVTVLYAVVGLGTFALAMLTARSSWHLASEDAVYGMLFFVPGVILVSKPDVAVAIARRVHPELTPEAPGILVLARMIGAAFILMAIVIVH